MALTSVPRTGPLRLLLRATRSWHGVHADDRSGHGTPRLVGYAAFMAFHRQFCLAAALLLTQVVTSAELHPLLDQASAQGRVLSAVSALTRGDAEPLMTLDAEAFLSEVGVPDPQDPRLVRRWTEILPDALTHLDQADRERVLAALSSRFTLLAAANPDDEHRRLRLALAFLPAPTAEAIIADAADRAFDRGHFRVYRAWADRLADDRRREVADQLGGFGAIIDSSLALPDPGPLVATATTVQPEPTGVAVRWQVVNGWLLAGDPIGRVRWQYRTDHGAIVVPGDGGAVMIAPSGIRFIDEQGTATVLPPLPAGGQALAVAGGAAWFQVGTRVHRWSPDAGLTTLELGAEPVCAPIVRGPDSLWLTATELLLVRHGSIAARFQHQRAVDQRWRLSIDEVTPMLVDADGRAERISDLATALLSVDPLTAFDHLLRAGRSAEVIAQAAADPELAADPAAQALVLRAHLLSNPGDPVALLDLAHTPADEALVLTWATRTHGEPWPARLRTWAQAHPDHVLTPLHTDPLADPDDAAWRVRAAVWAETATSAVTAAEFVGTAQPWAANNPLPQRGNDGAWRASDRTWAILSDLTQTTLTCHDDNGAELWRHQWPTPDVLIAPSRQLHVSPTAIVVIEGTRTLRVFDPRDGRLRRAWSLEGHDLAAGDVIVSTERIAALQPAWLQTELHILDGNGWHIEPLPRRGRWAVAWGERIVVVHDDATLTSFPAGGDLPADLRTGDRPAVLPSGIYRAGSLWPWSPTAGSATDGGLTPTTVNGSDAK